MSDHRPNLLFLMTDHQRADSLGMVQAGVEVTPHLNRLARAAGAFERAYTTCPLCAPARTALATGLYPTANGIVFNDWKGARARRVTPIHQLLDRAGYAVGHVGVDHVRVRPPLQKRLRFAVWASPADHARWLAARGLADAPPDGWGRFKRRISENRTGRRVPEPYSNTTVDVWPHPAEQFLDFWLAEQAATFLRTRSGPFALFVYLWAPHPPLRVPRPYAEMFDPQAIELPPNVGTPAEGEPPARRRSVAAQLAEGVTLPQWRKVWAAHLGLVRLADEAVGRVLQALDRTGRGEDTVVVFTVDHGDHLGQHAMYQKMEMYEPVVRVPLIVRVPGAAPLRPARPVSHLDVMPTVLEAMGLPVPEGLHGASLLPALTGGGEPPERPVFCQYSGNPALGDVRRAIVTDRHKYVYDPDDAPELYDLQADPLETTNLAARPDQADLLADLHARCAAWHRAHGDWVDFDARSK